MTASTFLAYLLTFLAGAASGATGLYLLLRGFLAGIGRAMPFRDEHARDYAPANRSSFGR